MEKLENFVHLHLHTHYSILDGACQIKPLVARAKELGMPACAITDHGYLFGLKDFYDTCKKEGIKPILGCETYIVKNKLTPDNKERGNHLVLLAKNYTGYKNLIKLISIASVDWVYYKPRISKELLEKYHEGLIASSACIAGEIPEHILNNDVEKAEESVLWYKNLFKDDFYLEIMLHKSNDPELDADVYTRQKRANEVILELGKKHDIKVIATNDVHFLHKKDAEAHDVLLCVNTGKLMADKQRLRYTKQEWFKSAEEMQEVFPNNLQELRNTLEVADKIEDYKLNSDPIMPVFPIPESFAKESDYETRFPKEALIAEFGEERYKKLSGGTDEGEAKVRRIKYEADYLQYLTQKGAEQRWPEGITDEAQERIDFELNTIKSMGFPGYFLIVQDFIAAAREMGILVGPGRGSAAGSVVAYCLKITNIDPIKYDLLFERFLNPDRISMPDIDVDFDDAGRQRILNWVAQKYGEDHVGHIVTFGSMAPKSCIRDIGRALNIPLSEVARLTKMVPDAPKITFAKALKESTELANECNSSDINVRKTMELSQILDGTYRQPGVHACGVIISRDPLLETIPIMRMTKASSDGDNLLTTQFDGHFVEPIGLLKMDFLGLKTLTVIGEAVRLIKLRHGIDIDTDKIPLDDKKTYEVFSNGDTTGLFQFESDGMKMYLRELQPERLEDLVAMNALYRPGPMEKIPQFIARKHGREEIVYEHPLMEKYLKETYGIFVYQEQVMLLSRRLGGFTRGESDTLRKAMGKKNMELMEALKEKFKQGCLNNPKFREYPPCADEKDAIKLIDSVWSQWQAFASYAFNKSHAVCYAYVAYITGYLKANYPAEYMCAQISSEIGNFDKMPNFISEAMAMGFKVLPPDINKSIDEFVPETLPDGSTCIRYGLGGIKGVGLAVAEAIYKERESGGEYKSFDDFIMRMQKNSTVNSRAIESLIKCGAVESAGINRAAALLELPNAIARASTIKKDIETGQASLFGDWEESVETSPIPNVPDMPNIDKLINEFELLGVFVSGHPMDSYKTITHFMRKLSDADKMLENFNDNDSATINVAAFVISIEKKMSKKTGSGISYIKLDDGFGSQTEIPYFPPTNASPTDPIEDFQPKTAYMITFRLSCWGGKKQKRITSFMKLDAVPLKFTKTIFIRLSEEDKKVNIKLAELKKTLSANPGYTSVSLVLELKDGMRAYITPSDKFFVMNSQSLMDELINVVGSSNIDFDIKLP